MKTVFSELIRSKREHDGLSLSEAARRIGITKSHLWDLEAGRSGNPCGTVLLGISNGLSIKPHHLIDALFVAIKSA